MIRRFLQRSLIALAAIGILGTGPVHADLIKQSSTYTRLIYMQDSTASRSPGVAGLTLTITASKAGAAFASITPTVTDLGSGWYSLAYTTTHTNTLGAFALKVTGTGADETDALDQIVAFDPADAVRLGLTALPNAAASASGGLITVGTGSGQINPDGSGKVSLSSIDSLSINAGTAQAGASGTVTLASAASSTDSFYNGMLVKTYGGTGSGQVRLITGYVGATRVATVMPAWSTTPDATTTYVVMAIRTAQTDGSGFVFLAPSEHTEIAADTKDGLYGIQPGGSPAVGSVYAILNKFLFDASSYVKSAPYAYGTGQDPATMILGATASSWNTALTIGAKINSAAAAGDPWSTALPGSYASGTAGYIVGNRLDAAISSRQATITLPTNFSTLSIDGSGKVLLQPVQTGVTIPTVTTVTTLTNAPSDSSGISTLLTRIPGTVQPQTGDSFARLGAPAGASHAADVAAIPVSVWAVGARTITGNVTVGGYAAGQDPATQVMAGVVDGSLTIKQILALSAAILGNNFTVTRNTTLRTLTVTYYRADRATTFCTMVTTYSDSNLTQATGRTATFSNLP